MARQLLSVAACFAAVIVILAATSLDGPSRGAIAKPAFAARSGNVSIELGAATLQELGWSFTTGGPKEEEVGLGQPVTFQIQRGPTLQVTRSKEREVPQISGQAKVRGALLLTGLGERVVIGNFVIGVDEGLWTITNTIGGPEDQQVVFKLSSVLTDFSAAEKNLRVVGELSVAPAWADYLGAPEAAGIAIGVMTLDVNLDPPSQAPERSTAEPEAGAGEEKTGTIGSDVLVADLQEVMKFGRVGDITAYAVGTNACNIGDERASWVAYTNQHPVISQNMYRLKDGRFEQIGMSWVKHGFYAVSEDFCGPCTDVTDGSQLGVGCSDPYTAYLNGVQGNMSLRSGVNPHTGYFDYPWTAPAPTTLIDKRLQVHDADLDFDLNPDAEYFIQGHYIHPDDCQAGTQNNNASYRPARVSLGGRCVGDGTDGALCNWNPAWENGECRVCIDGGLEGYRCESDAECPNGRCPTKAICEPYIPYVFHVRPTGQTQRGESAIRAWQDTDSTVDEIDLQVPDEGLFILGAKATPIGDGFWHYEYAIQNLNSDRSAGWFEVPLQVGVIIRNIGFHDVDYHSGEIYASTDWDHDTSDDWIMWATESYEQNPNANALRFGTVYNFRFDANVGPGENVVTLGLFKPGAPSEIQGRSIGPYVDGGIDCQPNGIEDRCDLDCGMPGEGCDVPGCGQIADCNENGIPDDCEWDCNDNDIADACDIRDCPAGELWCGDCDENTIPDGCQEDCDGDGIPDVCDTYDDTDGDGIADCFDLCPETTTAESCICPPIGWCCWPWGCVNGYPRIACIADGGIPDCIEMPCHDGCLIGDGDEDGDRDIRDVAGLMQCFSGPLGEPGFVPPSSDCAFHHDFDDDGDVDLDDYDEFAALMEGP